MKKQIAKVFYDKTISILASTSNIDAEGGVNYKGYEVLNTFKGNVNFSNCKQIQEEYGLDYQIDISITTDYEGLTTNTIIQYKNQIYLLTDILKHDSHILVVATKWRQ